MESYGKEPFTFYLTCYTWHHFFWGSPTCVYVSVVQFSFFPSLFLSFRLYLFIFRDRGMEGERDREKHRCAREILIGCLLHDPKPRHVPLFGNQTSNFSTSRLALSPLRHTRRALFFFLLDPHLRILLLWERKRDTETSISFLPDQPLGVQDNAPTNWATLPGQFFTSFYCWVLFCFMDKPQSVYPFTRW